jgi:hypothetical protein
MLETHPYYKENNHVKDLTLNLLHVKEPQAPSEQNYRPFPVQGFGRGLAMS